MTTARITHLIAGSPWEGSAERTSNVWKNSLFGHTLAHGIEGVHFFTRGKVVTSRWLDPSHGGVNLGFPQND